MHVPRGKPVHENLSTSYVNVAALLSELRLNSFTGYVYVGFTNYDGYVFFNSGRIVNALEQTEDSWKTNIDAVDSLLVRSKNRGGAVSVFDHPATVISAIAGAIDGQAVYQGLTSDFTNLPRLLERLSKEPDKSYYTEVLLEQSSGTGLIYTGSGRTDAVFSTGEGETMLGEVALREMLARANDIGATINVYRPSPEQHDIMLNETGPAQSSAPVTAPKTTPEPKEAPQPPKPAPEPPSVAAAPQTIPPPPPVEPFRSAPPIEMTPAPPPIPRNEDMVQPIEAPPPLATTNLPSQAARTQPLTPTFVQAVPTETAFSQTQPFPQPTPARDDREDLSTIVGLMEEVLQTAERTATGTIKDGGEFATALREGLLEVTDTYPFLDPFAGEFEYRKGQLQFRGKAQPAEFVTGTTTALRQALQTFARRFGDRSLPSRVQQNLKRLIESRGDEFQYHGLLSSVIDDIDR
ncbi:MAG TPA: hypothetical protein VFC63_15835 [Blastocatellia bacterium]|nr:hypothetical protein [Blastocatellia bacterium]